MNAEIIKKADAAVIYICGQSNAHAHAQKLPKGKEINEDLSHVFTLDYRINGRPDNDSVTWRPYTSQYNNLGEHQDNTCTLGYNIAKEWEKRIDNGEKLPDLYIVQISVGGQGLINGSWNMEFEADLCNHDALLPLYPLALHTFRLVFKDLQQRFSCPVAMGLHWIGSESDATPEIAAREDTKKTYETFFDTMLDAIGFECPLHLYSIAFYTNGSASKKDIDMINGLYEERVKKYKECRIIDIRTSELWNNNDPCLGIFAPDKIHYTPDVQKWFAVQFFKSVFCN